jgi:L-ascorbate metabolism protein UlaG (beta-lactamase superfamily)
MQGFKAKMAIEKRPEMAYDRRVIITYFGDHAFRIESGSTAILFNPPNNRLKADVTIWSEAVANDLKLEGREINFAGDYEIQGIEVRGWAVDTDKKKKEVEITTSYLISWEDIHLAFLGPIDKRPGEATLDAWDGVGVLFLPVGDNFGLAVEEAVKLAKQLEPGYVIVYGPGLKDFSKKIGRELEKMEKLVFKRKDIPEKTTFITFS